MQTKYQIDDPTFSVWNLIQRVEKRSTQLNHRRTMNIISHEIEDVTLSSREGGRVFAGFQYMSRFLPQLKRYQQMAQYAGAIYVFGIPDADVPEIPNVHYVTLSPDDALSKEWFIISYSDRYASALATVEQSQFTDPDERRTFKGLWTFDKDVVAVLNMWMLNMLNVRDFEQIENPDYDRQRQIITIQREIERLNWLSNRVKSDLTRSELLQLSDALKQESISLSARGA